MPKPGPSRPRGLTASSVTAMPAVPRYVAAERSVHIEAISLGRP